MSWAPHRVFKIGNSRPIPLMDYIEAIEQALGIMAEKHDLPMQAWVGFKSSTPVREGVARFVAWYRQFYRS